MEKELKAEEIIKKIESLLEELRQLLPNVAKKSTKDKTEGIKEKKGFLGLTGKIHELMEEGFFDEPKTIADLQKKLKDRGINRPTTSLMPSLQLLILKRVLDRNKPDKGLYNYFKR